MKTTRYLLAVCLIAFSATAAMAAPVGSWGKIVSNAAKTDSKAAKLTRAEKVAADLSKQKAGSNLLAKEGKLVPKGADGARVLENAVKAGLHSPSPDLLRQVALFSTAELDAAVPLIRGAKTLGETVPDVARRAKMIEQGGADMIAAIGMRGQPMAKEASRFSDMVNAGKLPARIGDMDSLARMGEIMRAPGGAHWDFWSKYVTPHWGKWLAGGALVSYLANPEAFHDAAGKITETGAKAVTEITGAVVEGALRGAAEGGKGAIDRFQTGVISHLTGERAWPAYLGIFFLVWVTGLLLPRTRRIFGFPFLWLMRKPK